MLLLKHGISLQKRSACQDQVDQLDRERAALDEEVKRLELCEDLREQVEALLLNS